ncbi:hypothetical protein ASF46_18165 [Rathayibacter sp. Leaf296]|nr:hypothetical protein ASF46_18165 [Rathayibacter sp. Leaf296]
MPDHWLQCSTRLPRRTSVGRTPLSRRDDLPSPVAPLSTIICVSRRILRMSRTSWARPTSCSSGSFRPSGLGPGQ